VTFALKRKIHGKFSSPLNINLEGPKFSRIKYLRQDKNLQNPRNFSPSKILGYTVLHICCCTKSSDIEIKNTLGVKKCKTNQKQQSK